MSDLTTNAIGQRWVNPVYRIKPLEWEPSITDVLRASVKFGNYMIYCKNEVRDKYQATHSFDILINEDIMHLFDTLDEAKAWCEQDWQNRITQCLDVVDVE